MYIWEFRDEKILFVKTSYINGDYVKHVKKLFKTTGRVIKNERVRSVPFLRGPGGIEGIC